MGALLYGGPRAVLSHTTAAEEWRMLALDPLAPVHITVPYGCSAMSQPPLVVVHRSRTFPYLVVATDPPRTSRADTVLDLATSEPDARAGMRRFVALATRGRVPVRELQWRLEERRPRRYGTALADALRLLAEGGSRLSSSATPATSSWRTRSPPRSVSSLSSSTAGPFGRTSATT
jgi:hypothetical protein